MADLLNLQAVLSLDSSTFENGIAAVKKGIGTSMKVIGAAVATGTAAVTSFAKASVTTGAEFDSSMSQIAATMGLTVDDIKNNVNGAGDTFEALRDKAKEMGSATNFSATQAAEGLNILAMSGYDAESSMEMIEDVLHLAAAGSMDMASAAAYVAGNMKGFNDATKDSGYYADLMAKGATLANTSVQQLGEAMSGGAASAAAYNQDAESMTLALLRLAEQGEAGSAASTALAAAMKNIYTPTDQAADALKELGIAAYDETGAARDFNQVVNELSAALGDMSDAQANAYKDTIFGIQGLDAFNKMTVTSIDKQNEWAEALAGATNEASKQYDTMTDNLEGDIDIFNSSLDGLKIAVSDTLTGTAREFVQFGSNALSSITKGFEEGGIEGAMDALSEQLGVGIGMLVDKLPTIVNAGTSLITSLAKAIVENAPAIVQALLNVAPTLIDAILELVPQIIDSLDKIFDNVFNAITKALPKLVPKLSKAFVSLMNQLASILVKDLPLIVDAIVESMPIFIDALGEIINSLLEHIPDFIGAGIELFVALLDGLIEALPQIIEWLPTLIQTLVDGLTENLDKIIQAGVDLLLALINAIPIVIPAIIEALPQIITSIVSFLLDNIPMLVDAGFQLIIGLVGAMPEIIASIIAAIPQIIVAIIDYFRSIHEKMKNVGKELLEKIASGIVNHVKAVFEAVGKIGDKIKEGFKGIVSGAVTWGKDMIDNFVQGIKDKIQKVKDTVSNVASTVKDFLGFSEPDKGPLSNFHTYAPDMMDLFAKGITENEDVITGAIEDAFNFNDYLGGYTTANAQGVNAGVNNQEPNYVIENHLYLEGEAKGVFKLVRTENRIQSRAAGYNLLGTV